MRAPQPHDTPVSQPTLETTFGIPDILEKLGAPAVVSLLGARGCPTSNDCRQRVEIQGGQVPFRDLKRVSKIITNFTVDVDASDEDLFQYGVTASETTTVKPK